MAYFDADGRLEEQTADLVIVCGGAVESARLLLNTRHRLFPNGLGNRYDWVGRNLQSHTYPGAVGLFDFDTFDDLGPGASIAICDYNHGNPGLAGGGMLANEFIRLPYQFIGLVPPWIPRWGAAHKDFVRTAYKRTVSVMGPVQEMPLFDSRVQVDRQDQGPLGHSGGAPLGTEASAHARDRALYGRQGGSMAEGSRRRQHLAARSRARA